jgi:hypothetical protein
MCRFAEDVSWKKKNVEEIPLEINPCSSASIRGEKIFADESVRGTQTCTARNGCATSGDDFTLFLRWRKKIEDRGQNRPSFGQG